MAKKVSIFAEINGAMLIRTDLLPDTLFAWHGGHYVDMYATDLGSIIETRNCPGIVNSEDAEREMIRWAKELR